MTNPLKAAVREAMNEWLGDPLSETGIDQIASALARRGVVIETAANSHISSKEVWDRRRDKVMTLLSHNIDTFTNAGLVRLANEIMHLLFPSPQGAAGESPAPKPARKVVHFTEDDAGITALCNDGSFWRWDRRADHWRLRDMTRIPEFDLPQTGDEQ
jgi:hypothetical protein